MPRRMSAPDLSIRPVVVRFRADWVLMNYVDHKKVVVRAGNSRVELHKICGFLRDPEKLSVVFNDSRFW